MNAEAKRPSPSDSQVLYRDVVKMVGLPPSLASRAVRWTLDKNGIPRRSARPRDYLRVLPDLMRHMAVFGSGRDMRPEACAIRDYLERNLSAF